ncbi:hypothetical protein COU75_00880 [Candidatus Peregrinibacteria bacterium CG10_big_fil_rev_8_21_14_0_10_42_8]|nr:MAG: hypothetical protein COU75_00880 [Candidatus Peregrinibacteria bacterium CG10_big_fil_rev_8_21_14_0_10_42_8]
MISTFTILFGILALLASCTASSVPVGLKPSSEAQINFEEEVVPEEKTIEEVELPKEASILVPFMVQAPNGNWDAPYQEACEEASVIMLDYYLRNSPLEPDQANREILQLVQWEEANSYKYDVSILDLEKIVQEYYGYNTRVSENVTVESIKHEIAKGNPVIIPATGRDLDNPYYSGDGPWYHMLVVTGYDKKYFITNDPGTRHGLDYKYKHNVLLNAVHDWTGAKEEIRTGTPRMLIIERS